MSVALQAALPRFLLAAVFRRVCPDLQVDSRTRMRPSSKWISGAIHAGVWSNQSGSGSLGFRGRLNQSRSGSSSGIHSLIACQGGSIGSMVSMSKGGGGGRGSVTIPSQRPWRRRKNSISSRRMTLRTGFMVPLQQGHWSGSPPHVCRMRSRQRGRMSRADCFGGAGMRRMVDWMFEIGDLRLGEDAGGRMMRSGMSGVWPRVLLE